MCRAPLFPHLPVRFRDLGFWDVEEDPNFNERNRGAKYRAFRLRPDVPAEMLRIDCPSHRADEVRQLLLERGLESFYRLDGRDLLLEFADGVTAGPGAPGAGRGRRPFPLRPRTTGQPLGAWPNRNALQPVLVNMGQTVRWFVWPLPRPDSFIDLASTRQVLENLQHIGVSQELYDDLVGRLGSSITPPACRRCTASGCRRCSTRRCRPASGWRSACRCCATTPRCRRPSSSTSTRSARSTARSWKSGRRSCGDEVEELRAKKSGVEAEIEEVRKRLADEEAQKEKTAESVAEAVVARARRRSRRSTALLAEVAVLRPFLNNGAAAPPLRGGGRPSRRTAARPATPLLDLDAAYAHLKSQLENVGLQPRSASAVARETLTALSLGQAVFFQGSLAPVLARTAALALSGARWTELDVPGDLKDDTAVQADRGVGRGRGAGGAAAATAPTAPASTPTAPTWCASSPSAPPAWIRRRA